MSSFYSNRTSRQNRLPDLQDSPKTPENATSYCRRTSQENLLPHFQDSPKTPVHNDHSTCHTTRENLQSNLESSPEIPMQNGPWQPRQRLPLSNHQILENAPNVLRGDSKSSNY